jgi:LysR family transcriptional regulator, cyn operon transcriptional activator
MDLRFLPAFHAVYERKNLTAAARALRLSQPAVTYQLRQLETQVGTLFERRRTGMQPTTRGERLYAITRELLDRIAHLDDVLPRTLAISSVSVFGRYVVAPLLRSAAFADVPHALRFPLADEVIAQVAAGDCELGFVFRAVHHPSLACEPAFDERYLLIAPRRRALPAPGEVVPLVAYDEGDYVLGRWVGHHYKRTPPAFSVACRYEELEEVVAAVAAGRGCAIVPRSCLTGTPRVHVVHGARAPAINTVYAIWRVTYPLGEAAARLLRSMGPVRSSPRLRLAHMPG